MSDPGPDHLGIAVGGNQQWRVQAGEVLGIRRVQYRPGTDHHIRRTAFADGRDTLPGAGRIERNLDQLEIRRDQRIEDAVDLFRRDTAQDRHQRALAQRRLERELACLFHLSLLVAARLSRRHCPTRCIARRVGQCQLVCRT